MLSYNGFLSIRLKNCRICKKYCYFKKIGRIKNKKEGEFYEEYQKKMLDNFAKAAYKTACKEADSACFCFFYQPTMPEKVKGLRKKKINKSRRENILWQIDY